jgi:aminoglycoside 6'-N-acetyltransferase
VTREPAPVLRGERVTLRPVEQGDLERLTEILRQPEVARWFGTYTPEETADEFLHDQELTAFAIEAGGEIVGSVQFYEEDERDYRHAGMDIFLSTERQGRGIGPEALRVLARYLFEERGHHRLVIDPAAHNERAINAYESIGFRRVGVMREYERGPDGIFHDGLLLDLLAGELAE